MARSSRNSFEYQSLYEVFHLRSLCRQINYIQIHTLPLLLLTIVYVRVYSIVLSVCISSLYCSSCSLSTVRRAEESCSWSWTAGQKFVFVLLPRRLQPTRTASNLLSLCQSASLRCSAPRGRTTSPNTSCSFGMFCCSNAVFQKDCVRIVEFFIVFVVVYFVVCSCFQVVRF